MGLALFCLAVCVYCLGSIVHQVQALPPVQVVQLPKDDAVISTAMIQWWYWTGFLTAEDGRLFGFEICTFLGRPTHPQVMHVAVSDIKQNKFSFDSVTELFDQPLILENAFNFTGGSPRKSNLVTVQGGDGSDALFAQVGGQDGYTLDLKARSKKAPAIHYGGKPHKYSRAAGGGFTYYYSRTSMEVTGSIVLPGDTQASPVSGQAWFDRQYGDLIRVSILGGWQWFAISLSDDTQIMIFFTADIESADESSPDHPNLEVGSITDPDGVTTALHAKDTKLEVLDTWTSSRSGCKYPSGWQVTVLGKSYNIQPLIKDQELGPTTDEQQPWVTPIYWEGANTVTGDQDGRAYVELNGFCPHTD